jgi:hypothetical protein
LQPTGDGGYELNEEKQSEWVRRSQDSQLEFLIGLYENWRNGDLPLNL